MRFFISFSCTYQQVTLSLHRVFHSIRFKVNKVGIRRYPFFNRQHINSIYRHALIRPLGIRCIFFFYRLAGAGFLLPSYGCFFTTQKGLFTNLDLFLTRRREIFPLFFGV